eukprot:747543-Hanusia_phi.AAC.6
MRHSPLVEDETLHLPPRRLRKRHVIGRQEPLDAPALLLLPLPHPPRDLEEPVGLVSAYDAVGAGLRRPEANLKPHSYASSEGLPQHLQHLQQTPGRLKEVAKGRHDLLWGANLHGAERGGVKGVAHDVDEEGLVAGDVDHLLLCLRQVARQQRFPHFSPRDPVVEVARGGARKARRRPVEEAVRRGEELLQPSRPRPLDRQRSSRHDSVEKRCRHPQQSVPISCTAHVALRRRRRPGPIRHGPAGPDRVPRSGGVAAGDGGVEPLVVEHPRLFDAN